MSTTISQIREMLDGHNLTYMTDEDAGVIALPIPTPSELQMVFLTVEEDGEFVMLRMPGFLSDRQAANKELLYRQLLSLNHRFKLGRFGLDPKDGEVALELGIPIEDGNLTDCQLRRSLSAVVNIASSHRDELRKMILTGVDQDAVVKRLLGELEPPNETEQ